MKYEEMPRRSDADDSPRFFFCYLSVRLALTGPIDHQSESSLFQGKPHELTGMAEQILVESIA